MANLGEEVNGTGVFGGVEYNNGETGYVGQDGKNTWNEAQGTGYDGTNYGEEAYSATNAVTTTKNSKLPTKRGFWSSFKAFWLQEIDWNTEIKVELTPYQQKIEDEINEFLHQEITWEKVHNFLFQEVRFGK